MKTFLAIGLLFAATMVAGAVEPGRYQTGPKNLVSPTYRAPITQVAPHRLTKRDIAKLSATAETASQHLAIARYYREQADQLDAQGVAYEQAAAGYRSSPAVKNLVSPTTAGRFEFIAAQLRDEANTNRALSISHERMAKGVSAKL